MSPSARRGRNRRKGKTLPHTHNPTVVAAPQPTAAVETAVPAPASAPAPRPGPHVTDPLRKRALGAVVPNRVVADGPVGTPIFDSIDLPLPAAPDTEFRWDAA